MSVVVGDLHGKWEIVEIVLEQFPEEKIIFVGDYLDSFTHSDEDLLKTFILVQDSILESDGRIMGLVGNHDLQYFDRNHLCSGYRRSLQTKMSRLSLSIFHLEKFIWDEGFLITHAGLSNRLFRKFSGEFKVDEFLRNIENEQQANIALNGVGMARGGIKDCGGIFWCDWHQEFEPIDSINQVVGHSAYRKVDQNPGIISKGNNFNIDCLDRVPEVLIIENGKAKPYNLKMKRN